MRFVIVTGVSGAGKSTVLKMLEDAHYFCVDNLPIPLVEKFASLMLEVHEEGVQNAATVPTSGTLTTSRRTRLKLSSMISMALGFVASRRMYPFFSRASRWA